MMPPARPPLDVLVRARWPSAVPLAEAIAALVMSLPRPVDADLVALLVQAGWARAARHAGATHEALCDPEEGPADRRAFTAAFLGSRAAPLDWETPRAHLLRLVRFEPEPLTGLVFVLTTAALRRLHPEHDLFPRRRRDRHGRRIGRTPAERWGDRLREEAGCALAILEAMDDPGLVRFLGPILRGAEGRAAGAGEADAEFSGT